MCNIGTLVSVRKASTADLMVSRRNGKTQVTSNASNETPRFDAVYFLEAVLVGFNYLNYILKHPFREITLIIIETNTLPATVFWNKCKLFRNFKLLEI